MCLMVSVAQTLRCSTQGLGKETRISPQALRAALYCVPHPHFPGALNRLWLGVENTQYSGKPAGLFRAVLSA